MNAARRRRSAKPRRARGRRLIGALASLLGLGVVTLVGAFWYWTRSGGPADADSTPIDLGEGTSLRQITLQLNRAGIVRDPKLFQLYLWLHGAGNIRRGEHLLRLGLTPRALAARLTESGLRPVVKVSFPEGFNRFQFAERLQALDVVGATSFLAMSAEPESLEALNIGASSAEGYLFPATYDFYVDSTPALVLRTLVQETFRRFERVAASHAGQLAALRKELGWGTHEVLTLASIVEKEAAHPSEHGLIASVFYNRLRDPKFFPRQMLQSDPTAGYGCLIAKEAVPSCRGFAGKIKPAMLRDEANEYNTYKRPGLPPGPIGNPSASAVLAVVAPPVTPYFFFVSTHGQRHVFSRTLAEHERAITAGSASDQGNEK